MQMKKRVLSVLLALCLAGSLASTAWAAGDTAGATPSPASVTQNLDENAGEPAELNENGEDLENTDLTDETLDEATDGTPDSDSTGVPEEGDTSDNDGTPAEDGESDEGAMSAGDESDSTQASENNIVTGDEPDPNASNGALDYGANAVDDASERIAGATTFAASDGQPVVVSNRSNKLTVYVINLDPNGDANLTSKTELNEAQIDNDIDSWVNALEVPANYRFVRAVVKPSAADARNATDGQSDISYFEYGKHWEGLSRKDDWWYSRDRWTWNLVSRNDTGNTKNTVYFVFEEIQQPSASITIADQLVENGYFTPVLHNISSDVVDHYVWMVSDSEDGPYTEVANKQVNGNDSLKENGLYFYPSVDGGAEKWYKVKAVDVNGNDLTAESEAVYVPYFDELKNGGFEYPEGKTGYNNVSQDNSEVIWKTTASDHNIEIVGTDNEPNSGEDNRVYGVNDDAETTGSQFAELNANQAGALYQDVLTVPGTTLNWQLMHRARNHAEMGSGQFGDYDGDDTMYVIIMSTNKASDYTTQNQIDNLVSRYANQLTDDNDYYLTEDGIGIWKITDGDAWTAHNGAYVVPADQHVTRFFFASGETAYDKASGNASSLEKTCGNFLDAVSFSATIEQPTEGYANITVVKNVEGTENPGTIAIQVTGNEDYNGTYTFTQASFVDGRAQYTFEDIPVGNSGESFTVSESVVSPEGITCTASSYQLYTIQNDQWQPTGDSSSGSSATFTVSKNGNYVVEFTNTYEEEGATPSVPDRDIDYTKFVEYNSSDDTYDLSLDVTGAVGTQQGEAAKVDVLLVVDKSGSMAYKMDEEEAAGNYEDDRMDAVKGAVGKLVNILQQKTDAGEAEVKYSLVTFSSIQKYKGTDYTLQDSLIGWTSDATEITNTLDSIQREGGTNYEYAMYRMINQLNAVKDDGTKKIVIFLTDGVPTNRGGFSWETGKLNKETNYEYDRVNDEWLAPESQDNSNDEYVNVNAAVKALTAENFTADKFYCIGIGPTFDSKYLEDNEVSDYENGQKNLDKLVAKAQGLGIDAKVETSTDPEDLSEIFAGIANDAVTNLTTGVTIDDILSENVQAVGDGNIRIEILENDKVLYSSEKGSKSLVAPSTTNNSGDETSRTITAELTQDGHLKLDFPDTYKLEPGWTYRVTMTIQATEEAYANYRTGKNGTPNTYPDVGGEDTGVTSEGKDGVKTNDKATLTYTFNGKTTTEEYKIPVIQLHPKTLTITKTVQGLNDLTSEEWTSYQNNLKFTVQAGGYSAEIPLSQFTKAEGGSYVFTKVIEGLAPGATYSVSENNAAPENYVVDQTATTNTGNLTGTMPVWNMTDQAANVSVGFTNAYKLDNVTLTVWKHVKGNQAEHSRNFTFTASWSDSSVETITGVKTVVNLDAEGAEPETSTENITVVRGGTFTLKADESVVFTVPSGLQITIDEDPGEYSPEITGAEEEDENEDDSDPDTVDPSDITVTVNEDTTLTFTNTKEIVGPVTGLERNDTPYTLMVTAAGIAGLALIGGIVAARRRRRRME